MRNYFVLKMFFLIALVFLFFVASPALAVFFEVQYPSVGSENIIPGGGPVQWIRYIFLLALGITSVAAVGSLIYAGIIWMTSTSQGKVAEAQERIRNAIIGIIIVASSWLLLNTINPALVTLRNPNLQEFNERINYFDRDTEVAIGESCETQSECSQGFYCQPDTKKCLAAYSGQGGTGQSCDRIGSRACGDGLFCAADTKTCEDENGPRKNEQELCSPDHYLVAKRCHTRHAEGQRCNPRIQNQCQSEFTCKQRSSSDDPFSYCLP